MSYPLIIIGAGASYDLMDENDFPVGQSLSLKTWKPPLTNQLFDGVRFQDVLNKYPEMADIVSVIAGKLKAQDGSTFESILTKLFEEGVKKDPGLYKEFAALLFYLSDLFGKVSTRYHQPRNNYAALHHHIKQNGAKAVFVNFNYELLLEQTLDKKIANVDDFIDGDLPIIKIHGACNWYWRRRINLDGKKPSYNIAVSIAELLFSEDPVEHKWELVLLKTDHDPKDVMASPLGAFEGRSYHPALALPIFEKNNYVCPDSHIEYLKEQLSEVDRIVIIGWKIGDKFLRDVLLQELKKRPMPIAFVGGENSNDVVTKTEAIIRKNVSLIDSRGFSHFISSVEAERFFQ